MAVQKSRPKKRRSYRPRISRPLKSYILNKLRQADDRPLIKQVKSWFEELSKTKSDLLGKRTIRAFAALVYRLRKARHLKKVKSAKTTKPKRHTARQSAPAALPVIIPTDAENRTFLTRIFNVYLARQTEIEKLEAENAKLLDDLRKSGMRVDVGAKEITLIIPLKSK